MFASVYFVRLLCFWQNVEECRSSMSQHIQAISSDMQGNYGDDNDDDKDDEDVSAYSSNFL